MKRKTKIITVAILSSLIAINSGYLIYEAFSTKDNSLAYKLTHHSKPVNLKDNTVSEIKLENLDGDYLIRKEPYKLNYEVLPLDAYDPSITITSSNPSALKINDDNTFSLLKDDEEVKVTLKSNSNPKVIKELNVHPVYKKMNEIEFIPSSNVKVIQETDPVLLEVKQNEVFNLTFKDLNEEIIVNSSKSITRISDSNYYFINDNYSETSDCFIKGNLEGNKSKVINFNATSNLKEEASDFKFFFNNEEVKSNELVKDKTYIVKAFNKENKELDKLPFIIEDNNPLIDINYNEITFKEANTYKLKISLFEQNKEISVKANDVINSNFELVTEGTYSKKDDKVITTYLNRGFRYFVDKKDTTINDFDLKVTTPTNNILVIKDDYIQAKGVGKVVIEVAPSLEAYKDYKKTYEVNVLPLEEMWSINEIYIFGSIICLTSILITLLIYFLLDKKNSLYTLFTYLAGLILVGGYSLLCLVSNIRYPSVAIFFIYYLIYLVGSTFTYIAIHIFLMYKEKLKKKEIK